MRTVKNPTEFRRNVCLQLEQMCPPSPAFTKNMIENIEKSVYNASIKDAGERDIVKKWDNPYFVQLYTDRLRSIYINLKQSDEFRQRLISKEIKESKNFNYLIKSINFISKHHKMIEAINRNSNPYYLNLQFVHIHLIFEWSYFVYLRVQNIDVVM